MLKFWKIENGSGCLHALSGHTLFQWPSRRTLLNGASCSDDPAAAHYLIAHIVPMVGLWPTTEPYHILFWNYNRLKLALGGRTLWVSARFGWSLAVLMTTPQHTTEWRTVFRWPSHSALPNGARCSDDLAAAHYQLAHAVSMHQSVPKGCNHPKRATTQSVQPPRECFNRL